MNPDTHNKMNRNLPTDASIILTYRCCMRCRMCDIWKHPSDILKEIKARDLEILPRLKFINITGGEPFVRNDIEDIIEVAFTKTPRVVISTAGYHVDEILGLADRFPNIGIRVSLEGLSTINDYMRGRSSGFDRGLQTLLGLRQMGVKDIGIATTVSHNNCHELLSLYRLTKNMKMDFATATFHNSFYFHKKDNHVDQKDEVADCFFNLADELLKSNNPKDWFRSFFNIGLINYIHGNKRLLPCEAGSVNFFIEPYGDVYPCNGLEERFWKKSMGNIKDVTSFSQLWHSQKAKQVRTLVATCPKNCWMVGTASPVMKKYIKHPLKWVIKHKFNSLFGKKIDRSCLPEQYRVGQDPQQGNLKGDKHSVPESKAEFPIISPQRLLTSVVKNERLTRDAFRLTLEKGSFRYLPGQNVSIGPYLKYDQNRDYTFSSSPMEDHLEFLIKKVGNGRISPYLSQLKPGDKVEISGPSGDFILPDDPAKKYLFIATGVGIGPFHSFIKTYQDLDFKLIHGIRYLEDCCLGEGIPKDRYISCITRENAGDFHGRVTEYIKASDVSNDTLCYICGNPYMLKQIYHILIDKGIPGTNIFKEAYYTY